MEDKALEAFGDLQDLDDLAREACSLGVDGCKRRFGQTLEDASNFLAEFQLGSVNESLKHRLRCLWSDVLPSGATSAGEELGFQALFRGLARSPCFRELFTGPRRSPFLLPRLPCVAGLLTVEEVARGLQSGTWPDGACPYSAAIFVNDGRHMKEARPLPPVESYDLLEECLCYGTVMVMHSGNHWRSLANLALASVEEFQVPSNNTIFLTGADRERSLNLHTDNHNTLILQTGGSKRWRVYPPPPRRGGCDPLARGKNHDVLAREELEQPLIDVVLHKGQSLFVPFGFPHETDTLGTSKPSLHVTLSMYPTPTFAVLRRELLSAAGATAWQRRAAPAVRGEEEAEEALGDEAYWQLTSFVTAGFLAAPPGGARRGADASGAGSGRVLVAHVARELCARTAAAAAAAAPGRLAADDAALYRAACEVVVVNLRGLLSTLRTYTQGFREVASAAGEFPASPPRALLAAFGCGAPPPRERRRVDPEDGRERTREEVRARYAGQYALEEIDAYWLAECRPVADAADGAPKRLDPADGVARTRDELRRAHGSRWSPEELDRYWEERCRSIFPGDSLPPELLERADRALRDVRALLEVLREQLPHVPARRGHRRRGGDVALSEALVAGDLGELVYEIVD